MTDLSDFPVSRRWPASYPDRLQLYSVPSPNGVKISIFLKETGLPYEAHRIPFGEDGTRSAEYLALNPYGKIPVIIDPSGPGGQPLALFESGAILLYLAEKTGQLLPSDAAQRWEAIQWLFWQVGGVGPMFGQIGYFHRFGGKAIEDPRPLQRYVDECKRLLAVLDRQLEGREWVIGDYSIADISLIGWVRNLIGYYEARELVGFEDFGNVGAWLDRALARPAVQRGLKIPE
ncbi:MAG: glutathione S-transferase N-terminal domain-containing protein [Sphingomicrobium sp.]